MPSDPNAQFDDPALKAAVKRACGTETAPTGLRGRIVRALDAERSSAPSASDAIPLRTWRSNRLVGLAAAAIILLAFSLVYRYMADQSADRLARVNLPATLANAMVITADQGPSAVEVNLAAKQANPDYPALDQTLRARLKHPVLATALGPEWTLKSAGVATLGGEPASQLLFVRGNDTVSLFSVDGTRFYASTEGSDYDQVQNGHPISGFVYKGAVHCVVGGPTMSAKEVTKLRDKLRAELTAART